MLTLRIFFFPKVNTRHNNKRRRATINLASSEIAWKMSFSSYSSFPWDKMFFHSYDGSGNFGTFCAENINGADTKLEFMKNIM
jgi:hypothetical protein